MSESTLGNNTTFELLDECTAVELRTFLESQFKNLTGWFNLEELEVRLLSQLKEVWGVMLRDSAGQVIGATLSYRHAFSPDLWTLSMVAIDREYRGQGYGTALVRETLDSIKELGGRTVLADTNKLSSRGGSGDFLAKAGFILLCEIPGYFDGFPEETGVLFIAHL